MSFYADYLVFKCNNYELESYYFINFFSLILEFTICGLEDGPNGSKTSFKGKGECEDNQFLKLHNGRNTKLILFKNIQANHFNRLGHPPDTLFRNPWGGKYRKKVLEQMRRVQSGLYTSVPVLTSKYDSVECLRVLRAVSCQNTCYIII